MGDVAASAELIGILVRLRTALDEHPLRFSAGDTDLAREEQTAVMQQLDDVEIAGFGTLIEAFSGFAARNGFADKPPALPNLGLADMIAGLSGAFATLVDRPLCRGDQTVGRRHVFQAEVD